jgi:hypothetical protein
MKKTSLSAALHKAAARNPQLGRSEGISSLARLGSTPTLVSTQETETANPKSQCPPGRVGKKVISGFFDPDASKQLARLAINRDRSNEECCFVAYRFQTHFRNAPVKTTAKLMYC